MSYIAKLVPIYAKHDVGKVKGEEIEKVFGKSLEELALVSGFPKAQEFVESLAKRVEDNKEKLETADKKEQIGMCLRLLLQLVLFEKDVPTTVDLKMDTLKELLIQRYAEKNWSAAQREHFDYVFKLLKEWNAYFLSYTNVGGTIINAKYKIVIDMFGEPLIRKARAKATDNLLAEVIVSGLKKYLGNRRSFYDKNQIKLSDNVDEKIGLAISKTFVFVQLVQLETFDRLSDVNWSFKEYQLFQKHNELELSGREHYRPVFKNRFAAAILAAEKKEEIQLNLLPFEFESWSNRIFSEAHFLILTPEKDKFEGYIRIIANTVVNKAHKIIDNIPS